MKNRIFSCVAIVLFLLTGIEPVRAQFAQQSYTTTNIKNLGTMVVNDTMALFHTLTSVPQTNLSWKGNYCFRNTKGSAILRIRQDLMGLTVPQSFTCDVIVQVTKWATDATGASMPSPVQDTLRISYNKATGISYNESDLRIYYDAQYLGLKLISISNAAVKSLLELQLKLDGERSYCKPNFSRATAPCMLKTEYISGSDEWKITFDETSVLQQADEFDVEWTFVDFYDEASYRSGNPLLRNYQFKDNSTRVILGKNQRTFSVRNIFEKGFVVFRYRTVGYYTGTDYSGESVVQRLAGKWSIGDTGYFSTDAGDLETSGCYGVENSLAIINTSGAPHLPLLNWQYISVFAEEGKKKETISYYDGSMRGRQTVASNNADQTVLVQENIYDYNGRAAIQVLPVPLDSNMRFYANLNKADSVTPYTAADFDQDATGDVCAGATAPLDSNVMNSAARYYSYNNPFKAGVLAEWDFNKFIPVAKGYPFTQTVFMNDNTGRVAAQSGVGYTHRMDGDHATRYAYETPFREELTRLFGTDVGYAEHYKKSTTVDANGQASVSYTDLKGRVIATALAANPTGQNKMVALSNNSARTGVEVSLGNPSEVQLKEDEFFYSKRITVLETGNYKFFYSLKPQDYMAKGCSTATPCYDCRYDLDITIVNLCGENKLDGDQLAGGINVLHREIGGSANSANYSASCSTNTAYSFATDTSLSTTDSFITVTLQPGTYTIQRTLKVNEKAYRMAEDHYMANSVCKTFDQFLTEAESAMDMSGCYVTCESCSTQFANTSVSVFLDSMEVKLGHELSGEETAEWTLFYNDTKRKCDELSCGQRSQCDVIKDILIADVTPGGQYAAYEYLVTDSTPPVFTITDQAFNILDQEVIYGISNDLTTWIDGVEVAVRTLTPFQFVTYWDPSWGDEVAKLHPEYCEYTFCMLHEMDYKHELEVLNTETFADAVAASYLTGTNNTALDMPIGSIAGLLGAAMTQHTNVTFVPSDPQWIKAEDLVLFGLFYSHRSMTSLTYLQFQDSITVARSTKFLDCDTAYKDLYWTQIKGIYLSEHKEALNSVKTCSASVNQDHIVTKRFYSHTTEWPDLNAQPDSTYVKDALADHCETQCDSYKEVWADNLAGCNLDSAVMADLLDQLKDVCVNGCDHNFPLGASSVAPAKLGTATRISFEDVMRKFRYDVSNIPIFDSKVCSDVLITMPAPYGHDYFAKSSPYADTCACDNETSPENCPCSTSTAYTGPNNTAAKLLRPNVAEEDKCAHCVECSEVANAFYDFTTVYPMEFNDSPSYDKAETQERLVKHFNRRLGLNLSYTDYEAQLAACLGYASVPDKEDVFALYAQTYQLVQTKSMKEVGLIAANIAIPRMQHLKYTDEEQQVDGYIVDYKNTRPVYASANDQLMYIANITSLFEITFKTLHYTSLFFQLDCLCPKVLNDSNKYVKAPTKMLTNPNGATSQGYLDSVFSICKDWKKSMDECLAENGRLSQSGVILDAHDNACTEVNDRLADFLRHNPINIGYTPFAMEDEEFDCTIGLEEGNPRPGGGGGGDPAAVDCQYLMPFFVEYYHAEIEPYFDPSEISKTDLKVFLCNGGLFGDTEFGALIDAMNEHGANIDLGGTREEQIERLWSILILCRTVSCQSFMSIATEYDSENQSALESAEKGLHDFAAEGSDLALYTDFRDELNRQMNKPPYLTFFDDETVTRHFQSCAKGPCEIITQTLEGKRNEYPAAFDGPGLSTVQNMRRTGDEIVDLMIGAFLDEANLALARAPYFKTLDKNTLIAAVEMCEECITEPVDLETMQVTEVIDDLMGLNYSPPGGGLAAPPFYIPMLKHLVQSGWNVKTIAPTIANLFFAKSMYKDQVKYKVVSRALNNSWMYGEARPPAGNYFYVKIATIDDYGSDSVNTYDYLPMTPDGDFAFANITSISVDRMVRLSPFEIQVIGTATYRRMLDTGSLTQKLLITMPSYPFYQDYVSDQSCKHNSTVCNKPVQQFTVTVTEDPCITRLKLIAKANAYYSYNSYVAAIKDTFRTLYVTKCMNRSALNEQFRMKYDERQYQYTLYYYDQAGNLVKTIPPAGVQPLNATDVATADTKRNTNQPMSTSVEQHLKITRYKYNTLNQLVWQRTPDAGESRFWYDKVGRIVMSQNTKQLWNFTGRFSYTFYDGLGRIKETGQTYGFDDEEPTLEKIRELPDFETWMLSTEPGPSIVREQITRTFYDAYYAGYTASSTFTASDFTNLRGRVVHSAYYESAAHSTPQSAVHYSYDMHGNVKTLYREITELSPLEQSVKQVDYEYDLISGKVNRVIYQEGEADQYIHEYRYDAENRLVTASTGANSDLLEEDANYYYYLHGPMARMEYGAHDVQGLDYTYTIQGWLKSVNAPALDHTRDPGRDGYSSCAANRYNARDVFGFELSYFKGDYNPVYGFSATQLPQTIVPSGAGIDTSAPELYNGNIRYMVTAVNPFATLLSAYSYDQLNRLKRAVYYDNLDRPNNAWGTGAALSAHANTFQYDADGNILNQVRNGRSDNTAMDDLSYVYQTNTNKLVRVDDTKSLASYATDIDDQSGTNYTYDSIGNLVSDAAEEIQEIKWNVYGKITNIIRQPGSKKPDLIFTYTPDGHRTSKTVISKNGQYSISTYYARDAQGNVLATYSRRSDKIIDFDTLNYSEVNTKLAQLIGDASFGEFIAQLHNTHVSNSGFNNYIDSVFKANAGSLEARLMEMPALGVLMSNTVYVNWVLNQLDQEDVIRNIFEDGSATIAMELCECMDKDGPISLTQYILTRPDFTAAFLEALCQYDQLYSTTYAHTVLMGIYGTGCPMDDPTQVAIAADLDPLHPDIDLKFGLFFTAVEGLHLDCRMMQGLLRMVMMNNSSLYSELVASIPNNTMKAKWANFLNCGTPDAEAMLGYAEPMLKALYRSNSSLFISLVGTAGFSYSDPVTAISDLMSLSAGDLAAYMNTVGLSPTTSDFERMMEYMYILYRAQFNDLMNESYMAASYTPACATGEAYPCLGATYSKNTQIVSQYGSAVWEHLFNLNTPYNYAGIMKNYDLYNYLKISAKYHKAAVSTFQQNNKNSIYGASNGMYNYFNYIRSLVGVSTYNAMINHFMEESDTYSDTLKLDEWMLYGSSRLGSNQVGKVIAAVNYTGIYDGGAFSSVDYNLAWQAPYATTSFKEVRGSKRYELSNHLGNVLAVVSDKKIYHDAGAEYLNYNFTSSTGNIYPVSNATVGLSSGKLNVTTTGTSEVAAVLPVSVPAGKSYKVSFVTTLTSVTGISLHLLSEDGISQDVHSVTMGGTENYTVSASQGIYSFKFTGTGSGSYTIDNLVIREYETDSLYYMAELLSANDYSPFGAPMAGRSLDKIKEAGKIVVNNNRFHGTTDGWSQFNTATVSHDGGRLKVAATAAGGATRKGFSFVPGRSYKVRFRIDVGTCTTGIAVPMYNSSITTYMYASNIPNVITQSGVYEGYFTAQFSTTYWFFEAISGNPFPANFWVDDFVIEGDVDPIGGASMFGFNGKEDDDETSTQDYGMRIYNPRLGRFLSVDPLTQSYPWWTPYQFAGNIPIKFIDLDGLEPAPAPGDATPQTREADRNVAKYDRKLERYARRQEGSASDPAIKAAFDQENAGKRWMYVGVPGENSGDRNNSGGNPGARIETIWYSTSELSDIRQRPNNVITTSTPLLGPTLLITNIANGAMASASSSTSNTMPFFLPTGGVGNLIITSVGTAPVTVAADQNNVQNNASAPGTVSIIRSQTLTPGGTASGLLNTATGSILHVTMSNNANNGVTIGFQPVIGTTTSRQNVPRYPTGYPVIGSPNFRRDSAALKEYFYDDH